MALKITKIKPMFTALITTMNRYEDDVKNGALIDGTKQKGTLKEYQTVVAVGPSVRDINVGDMVMINPRRFANVNHKHKPNSLANDVQKDTTTITFNFDVVEMNDTQYLLLQDRDIDYVFEGEEVEDKQPTIIINEPKIIL